MNRNAAPLLTSAQREDSQQQAPASAESSAMAERRADKLNLDTLAADLLGGNRPANTSLHRHAAGTHRKRMRGKLGKRIASLAALASAASGTGAAATAAAVAAAVEDAAEGLEFWAYVRGFEAGHTAGQSAAIDAAGREAIGRQLAALERQHSDATVNHAERMRRDFAVFAGLPESASWPQIRERAEALRQAATMFGKWMQEGSQ